VLGFNPATVGRAGVDSVTQPEGLAGRLNAPCRALAGITATLAGWMSPNVPGWRWRFVAVAGVLIAFYCFSI
jgi:hypothetical protein